MSGAGLALVVDRSEESHRHAKVIDLAGAVRDGRYLVDPKEVATALLEHVDEEKGKGQPNALAFHLGGNPDEADE